MHHGAQTDPRQEKEAPSIGAVLLPYQQAWVADDAQLKIAEKSRRIGLTWAEAADDVGFASRTKAEGGQNVYYISANQDMGIEYIEACAGWAQVFNKACSAVEEGWWDDDEADKAIKTFTIKFPSGHRIVALTSRPANLRGKQGVVVIDEAAFHQSLSEMLKAAMALLIWGGMVRIISTHDGDDNPFNELVQSVRNGARRGSVHRITFQQAIDDGLYRRICQRKKIAWTPEGEEAWKADVYSFYGDGASEELDVIPRSGSGGFIPGFLIDRAMIDAPVIRQSYRDEWAAQPTAIRDAETDEWCQATLGPLLAALPEKLDHVYGLDYARSGDLTVIVPFSIGQTLIRTAPFIIELRNAPKRQQLQILRYLTRNLPNWQSAAFDATGSGEGLAEDAYEEFGPQVEQIKLNDAWYALHMPALKQAFQDGLIQIPRDADIRKDLLQIQTIRGIPKIGGERRPGADGGQRHGDAAVAICLAWYASLQEAAVIEFYGPGDGDKTIHRDDIDSGAAISFGGKAW